MFMFGFTNIPNILFSFVTCSMHKNHTKMQEMALKRLYFSKFSWGACLRITLEVLTPSARVRQIHVHPPPMLIAQFILIILQVTLKRKSKKKQPPKYSVFKNPMEFKKLQIAQGTKTHIYKTISFYRNTCK